MRISRKQAGISMTLIAIIFVAGCIARSSHELVCSRDGAERVVAKDNVYFSVEDGIWVGGYKGPGYRPIEGEVCWDRKVQP